MFAGLLTVVVFLMGVLFANFMDTQRTESLQNEVSQNMVDIESQQLQLSYFQSGNIQSCDAMKAGVRSIIRDYNDRLNKVQQYQEDSFFQQDQFQTIKQRYVLSGIRYYFFVSDLRQKCDMNTNTVLFFTETLEGKDCQECQDLGRQLRLIKNQYGESVLIFSIPTEMDDGMVEVLQEQYNITSTPAVVINSNKTLEGAYSRTKLESEIFG